MLFFKTILTIAVALPSLGHARPKSETTQLRRIASSMAAATAIDSQIETLRTFQYLYPKSLLEFKSVTGEQLAFELSPTLVNETQPACYNSSNNSSPIPDTKSCAKLITDLKIHGSLEFNVLRGTCVSISYEGCRIISCVSACASLNVITPSELWADSLCKINDSCIANELFGINSGISQNTLGDPMPGEVWFDAILNAQSVWPPKVSALCNV